MADDASPTARALRALELIQDSPGVTAERLQQRLGVSTRAVRRYVAILREAGIPIDSTVGRYGGYRVGRGFRVPPLMFSTAEAVGLVMAVQQGRAGAAPDDDDPVAAALAKIIRVLPAPIAQPAAAVRGVSTADARDDDGASGVRPEIAAALAEGAAARHRLRLEYLRSPRESRSMEVDPWGVALRHGRWYLLCWSHTSGARRILRVDRVAEVEVLPQTFTPPADLDPGRMVEAHLAEGWRYPVEILVDAPLALVDACVPRSLGRLETVGVERTRIIGSTENPEWYLRQIAGIPASFRIVESPEMRDAAAVLGRRLLEAGSHPGPA